jgi:hypothetical protein
MVPDLKFIVAGDFDQLLPVKDRLRNCFYKYSIALNELCDGNKMILSKPHFKIKLLSTAKNFLEKLFLLIVYTKS